MHVLLVLTRLKKKFIWKLLHFSRAIYMHNTFRGREGGDIEIDEVATIFTNCTSLSSWWVNVNNSMFSIWNTLSNIYVFHTHKHTQRAYYYSLLWLLRDRVYIAFWLDRFFYHSELEKKSKRKKLELRDFRFGENSIQYIDFNAFSFA